MPTKKSKSQTVKGEPLKRKLTDAEIEKIKAIEEAERLEKLPPHERLREMAKRRVEYADSLMQVTFPTLKAIKHVNGVIMLVADSTAAMKQAITEAEALLGPAASHADVMAEAERRRNKTTLMSVRTFKRNLLNTLQLCNGRAEMFGAGTGGGQLKDIYNEGVAAIREAEKFWAKENKNLTKEVKDFMNGAGVTNDESSFAMILGPDWKHSNFLDPDTKKLLGIV